MELVLPRKNGLLLQSKNKGKMNISQKRDCYSKYASVRRKQFIVGAAYEQIMISLNVCYLANISD